MSIHGGHVGIEAASRIGDGMGQDSPQVALLAFGTAVPDHRLTQTALGCWMAEAWAGQPGVSRQIKRLYELSGIETRHSCLADSLSPPNESRFSPNRRLADTPTTTERMEIYQREATALGTAAARCALIDYDQRGAGAAIADTITHLIVVSCTGFFAPGLDQTIARELNLRPTVQRAVIGFMGCAAAFNALRLAKQIVSGQPAARVLVVCVEICSIHIQPGHSRVDLVVGSLFADGAAACLVGAPSDAGHDQIILNDFYTEVVPDTNQEMVWQISDHGFTLHLSPSIPRRLVQVAPRALAALLGESATPQFWAIHPGGRAIVDRLADLFALTPEQVAPSLAVLRDYGNMSSPTILFVLHEMRKQLRRAASQAALNGVAMAFGPGLVVEMAHLTYQPRTILLRQLMNTSMVALPGAYVA